MKIEYGKALIEFDVIYRKRKTMEISVHPDMSVVIKAPAGTTDDKIISKVKKRAGWIIKQKKFFEQFMPRQPQKQYINGESHKYLGKNYRLMIGQGNTKELKLVSGVLKVRLHDVNDRKSVEKIIYDWYRPKAYEHFSEILENRWKAEFEKHIKPKIVVKKMRTRWGSLSENGILTLNIELIKAPRECIDYVIVHELCHLVHRNHDNRFYKLLDQLFPNWKKVKNKLEMINN
ncbi:MAG TPA: SprT family zinc-dependent metalloprotease [Clostridiales bacterium]|nr:SprT family zinc-dependent metalloprotease [Clostridiales bacterium]